MNAFTVEDLSILLGALSYHTPHKTSDANHKRRITLIIRIQEELDRRKLR